MQTRITGKHMEVGEFLSAHIENKIHEGVTKYLETVNDVNVVLHKENHLFHCDISLNTGTHAHMTVKSSAEASDAYVAFDIAAERMEKQLRRYKRKLKSHTEARKASEESKEFVKYVLSGHSEEAPEEDHNSLVVAEQHYALFTMSVSEAVMKMDLEDLPALMFINAGHGGVNVIYRRKDGNISWLDPRDHALPLAKAAPKAKATPTKKKKVVKLKPVTKKAKAKTKSPVKKAVAKKPAKKISKKVAKAKPVKKVAAKKAKAKTPVKKLAKKPAKKAVAKKTKLKSRKAA